MVPGEEDGGSFVRGGCGGDVIVRGEDGLLQRVLLVHGRPGGDVVEEHSLVLRRVADLGSGYTTTLL